MKKKITLKTVALALAVAAVLTLPAWLCTLRQSPALAELLRKLDYAAADSLYQTRAAADGDIVLVGIDDRAIEEFGPYHTWQRDIIATTVALLNESEDCHPAVIAVDVLYVGESDPDLDEWLAELAGEYGNVITACAAQYGTAAVADGSGDYYLDTQAIIGFDEPYPALREASEQGHINAMLDRDGILRHHLLQLTMPDGTTVPSMALQTARKFRETVGGPDVELPETDARGFWYLPFCGVPGDFDSGISVADVIYGEVPADYFADRIVLIGPYTVGLQDSYITAADHAVPMYGMEYQANAIQALLWGTYKRELSDSPQLVLLFLLLLGCFFAFRRRSVKVSTAVWLGVCLLWVLLCRLVYSRGYVLHVLWVPAGVTVVYIAWVAANYVAAAREKRMVTNTFKRYVDPSVIRELLKEDSDSLGLGGRMTDIAVLFVDIRGFTSMSEVLTPPQVVEILNRYLSLTTRCVMDNHGTLDKFVGDCTMAFWNAPLPQEDYIMNACKAAMDMVVGAKALSQELLDTFGRTVAFGVGVHVGPAVVGNIGASMRMDYTAIGDTVNTASRLESNAPGGTIYISRAVVDALGDRIRALPLETPIRLKGKAEGFEIFTLEEIREN